MFDMNSGYNGYSMSNRAAQAYEDGEKPLSKWTKTAILEAISDYATENEIHFSTAAIKKVKAKDLKNMVLYNSSWHHTSSYVNKTDFYALDADKLDILTDDYINKFLSKISNEESEKPKANTFRGDIYYLEWSGSRNYPKATEMKLIDVNIEKRGCFYYVSDDTGKEVLKKKINSNGTRIVNYAEEKEKRQAEKERKENIRSKSSKAALEFYDSLEQKEYSNSLHIYPVGRKPSPADYDAGIDNFFKIGEHRLRQEYITGILHLETWNGKEWINED